MAKLSAAYETMRKAGHKMAEGGECKACGGESCMYSNGGEVKGVHKPAVQADKYDKPHMAKKYMGESEAGQDVRSNDLVTLAGPKHKLNKTGNESAKAKHHEVLGEMKAMPNPKLKGLAHGGTLHNGEIKRFMDKGESEVGDSMTALPHGLDEGGEADSDDGMLDACCDELLSAIEKKDKKEILESLKAIILSVKG